MQYVGVANTTRIGLCWARAFAIVHRCRFGSGIGVPPIARESSDCSETPFDDVVRLFVFRAFWPGAGNAGVAWTAKFAVSDCGPTPETSPVTVTCQIPT